MSREDTAVCYASQTAWWDEWRHADGVSISPREDIRCKITKFDGDRPGTFIELRAVGTDYRNSDIYLDGRSRCKRILLPIEYAAAICELMMGKLIEHLDEEETNG